MGPPQIFCLAMPMDQAMGKYVLSDANVAVNQSELHRAQVSWFRVNANLVSLIRTN